tara:strand:+ start:1582 stop:1722 length:141 start_codon:yes stop_codon:yes gene_type:complete
MKALLFDAGALIGLAVIVYGVSLLSIPAAWICGGSFLFILTAALQK